MSDDLHNTTEVPQRRARNEQDFGQSFSSAFDSLLNHISLKRLYQRVLSACEHRVDAYCVAIKVEASVGRVRIYLPVDMRNRL